MDVAILYSGGKDSTHAIEFALSKGWDIKYLLSVKPNRTDCYLFHFATVEHTPKLAKMLNIPHKFVTCEVANPIKEANIVKEVVENNPVDSVILGGIGLQETQLKSIQTALRPLNTEVFASHSGLDHDDLMKDCISRGYKIMITQVASDGMIEWLGKTLSNENFSELESDSIKYGFHIGFEGGYADTLVLDAPFFTSKLIINDLKKVVESNYNGYVLLETKMVRKTVLSEH